MATSPGNVPVLGLVTCPNSRADDYAATPGQQRQAQHACPFDDVLRNINENRHDRHLARPQRPVWFGAGHPRHPAKRPGGLLPES